MNSPANDTTLDVTDRGTINLLRFRSVRVLFTWRGFPYVFQLVMLVIFVQPSVLLATPWVSAIGVALIVAAAFFAVREARLANPESANSLALSILMLALCFGLTVLGWGLAA